MELSQHNREFLNKLVIRKEVDLDDDSVYDCQECYKFWDSEDVVQWFSDKGYTLYSRVAEENYLPSKTDPRLSYPLFQEFDYPYSCHNAQPDDDGEPTLTAADTTGRIVYAQDSQGRHVAIKATRKDSNEYQILRFLNQQNIDTLRENCILPVLEFLPYDNSCFIVMPRWGTSIREPLQFRTLRDALCLMHSALKVRMVTMDIYNDFKPSWRTLDVYQALAFLHSFHIIHRDVSFTNFVINQFGDMSDTRFWAYWVTRRHQLKERKVVYAMIDFDLAKMLPSDLKKEDCRLPSRESFVGSYTPADTFQGEFDYNPFAYDVGSLGAMFCNKYQHYTQDIPLLAPFLDRMITKNTRKRFTAAEALCFAERILLESEEHQLSIFEYEDPEPGDFTFETYDKWKSLPVEFQTKWSAYREPVGIPFSSKILRAIVASNWLPGFLIPQFRCLISKIASIPRRFWAQCQGLVTYLRR